jgi:pseudomonalisin
VTSLRPLSLSSTRARLLAPLLGVTLIAGGSAAFASNTAKHQAGIKTTVLAGSVLADLARYHRVGATDPHRRIFVDVAIERPRATAEQAAYQAMYTKGSPSYHHFLTPAQFDARYGVSQAKFDVVRRFATAHGLELVSAPGSRDLLSITGTVAQVEKTFKVRLSDFAWPSSYRYLKQDGATFFANENDPTIPAGAGIFGVIGLNSAQRSHTYSTTGSRPAGAKTHAASRTPAQSQCQAGTCIGLTTPQDMWSIYGMPTAYTNPAVNFGQGQKMAIFGEGQTDPVIKNLRIFEGLHGLRRIPVNVVHADGPKADYSDSSGEVEWELDTQSSTGMSPKSLSETLYFGHDLSDASVLNVFNNWADDANGALQASASYGECEESLPGDLLAAGKIPTYPKSGPAGYAGSAGAAYTKASEAALLKANIEGRTLFSSTGDTGSSCPLLAANGIGAGNGVLNQVVPVVGYPASSPHAVAVGGTVLYGTDAAAPQRSLEYAWTFTGGGTSFRFGKPTYQNGIATIAGLCFPPGPAFAPCRGVPDVAAQSGDIASNGYGIVAGGETAYPGGGTSLSSPLWLGMWTRIQAASTSGLGFADPELYNLPSGDFFDVGGVSPQTTPAGNGVYVALPGWDYVSGLGTPNVTALMNDANHRTTPTNNVVPPEAPVAAGGVTSLIQPCKPLFADGSGDDQFGLDLVGTSKGQNPQLDIIQGDMHTKVINGVPNLETVMTLRDLSTNMAFPAGVANEYYFLWTYKPAKGTSTQYFTNAEVGTPSGTVTYSVGSVQGNLYQKDSSATGVTGSLHMGKNGTVVVDTPLKNVGSVAPGSVLTAPAAQTKVLVGSPTGTGSLQAVDDGGPDFNYALNEVCEATGRAGSSGGVVVRRGTLASRSPALATTGMNAALPIAALVLLGVLGVVVWLRRRPEDGI